MNKNDHIGVLDSGFGGLSVLKRMITDMPNESYIFFGDSINAPYGVRTKENILELTKKIYERLVPYGLKEMVTACNTISVNTTEEMREKYKDFPIIPITPKLDMIFDRENIIKKKEKTKIVIMATKATCESDVVKNEIEKHKDTSNIYTLPAPNLVTFVESLKADSKECEDYLNQILSNYMDLDYIVLGCTHLPFIINNLKKVLVNNPSYGIIDNGMRVANEAKQYLKDNNLFSDKKQGSIKIIDTKGGLDRQKMYATLLDIDINRLEFL